MQVKKIQPNLNLTKHRHFYFNQSINGVINTEGYLQRNVLGVVTCLIRSFDENGNVYKLWEESPKRIENMSFFDKSPDSEIFAGTNEKEVKQFSFSEAVDKEKYIIWSPESTVPPRAIITVFGKAQEIAINMSRRYGTNFYVARLTKYINGDTFGGL